MAQPETGNDFLSEASAEVDKEIEEAQAKKEKDALNDMPPADEVIQDDVVVDRVDDGSERRSDESDKEEIEERQLRRGLNRAEGSDTKEGGIDQFMNGSKRDTNNEGITSDGTDGEEVMAEIGRKNSNTGQEKITSRRIKKEPVDDFPSGDITNRPTHLLTVRVKLESDEVHEMTRGENRRRSSRLQAKKPEVITIKTENFAGGDPLMTSANTPSAQRTTQNAVNAIRANLKRSKQYQMLLKQINTTIRNTVFKLRDQADPDNSITDWKLDLEVYTRRNETAAKWDSDWQRTGMTTGYFCNYIVSCEERLVGADVSEMLLIKYDFYPVPSWEPRTILGVGQTAEYKQFRRRLAIEDIIEMSLRAELGDRIFTQDYPNRYMKWEKGRGAGGYVQNKRSLYVNRLRALEYRWTIICLKAGLPPIFVFDFTDDFEDDARLEKLIFSIYNFYSSKAQSLLKSSASTLSGMKCTAACGSCIDGKKSRGGTIGVNCCGNLDAISVDGNGGFKWCRPEDATVFKANTTFECTNECGCGATCRNRAMQHGRQMELALVREKGTGWGIRATSDIAKGQYISEYVGEVRVGSVTGAKYDYQLLYTVTSQTGTHQLVISAGKRGNESRFLNHSCQPNVYTRPTVVDRRGLGFHRLALVSSRSIMAGEALSLDYFPEKVEADWETKEMFRGPCRCRTSLCRFPEATSEEAAENENEEGRADEDAQRGDGTEDDKIVTQPLVRRDESTSVQIEKKAKRRTTVHVKKEPLDVDESMRVRRSTMDGSERKKTVTLRSVMTIDTKMVEQYRDLAVAEGRGRKRRGSGESSKNPVRHDTALAEVHMNASARVSDASGDVSTSGGEPTMKRGRDGGDEELGESSEGKENGVGREVMEIGSLETMKAQMSQMKREQERRLKREEEGNARKEHRERKRHSSTNDEDKPVKRMRLEEEETSLVTGEAERITNNVARVVNEEEPANQSMTIQERLEWVGLKLSIPSAPLDRTVGPVPDPSRRINRGGETPKF